MPCEPIPCPDLCLDGDSARAMMRALSLNARARGVLLRDPPPEPTSCCGRGCNGCVWESYYVAAAYWRQEALLRMAAAPPA